MDDRNRPNFTSLDNCTPILKTSLEFLRKYIVHDVIQWQESERDKHLAVGNLAIYI